MKDNFQVLKKSLKIMGYKKKATLDIELTYLLSLVLKVLQGNKT